jgi:hypothetical protein
MLPSARENGVGTPDDDLFEAQYSACTYPCQRFTFGLATARA